MQLVLNLLLKRTKSKELVFYAQRARLNAAQPPPLCRRIKWVESLLRWVSYRSSAAEHVTNVLSSCSGLLYALRILRTYGVPVYTSMCDVFSCYHAHVYVKTSRKRQKGIDLALCGQKNKYVSFVAIIGWAKKWHSLC